MANLRANPGGEDWLLRAIRLRTPEGPLVGLTGFHGPPNAAGSVEVGYEIEPPYRRQGFAVEATRALLDWAFLQRGVMSVVAAIQSDNEASLAVAARLGFRPAGSRWDAIEGTSLLFERRSAPDASVGTWAGTPPARRTAMSADGGDWTDIYPDRPTETRTIAQRLGSIFRDHGPDPADPERACACGYHGDNYVGHLTRTVLVDLKEVGWEVRPIRY